MTYLRCTKCEFVGTITTRDKIYYYHLQDGQELYAEYSLGYCFKCKNIKHIILGFSPGVLNEKIKEIEEEFKLIRMNQTTLPNYKIHNQNLEYELMNTKKYISHSYKKLFIRFRILGKSKKEKPLEGENPTKG